MKNVHELPVDAFVYENCSINVDTMTEFCTGLKNWRFCPWTFLTSEGTPITRGKMAVYTYTPYRGTDHDVEKEGKNPFNRTEVLPRMYHPDGTYWNGNRTIIRLAGKTMRWDNGVFAGKGRGTRVVNIQALKATGASEETSWSKEKSNKTKLQMKISSCFGDAGGSVWKFHVFRLTKRTMTRSELTGAIKANISNWIKGKRVKQEHKSFMTCCTEKLTNLNRLKIFHPHVCCFFCRNHLNNKNFRNPGSDAEPDPRMAKDRLAVLTGVISRWRLTHISDGNFSSSSMG